MKVLLARAVVRQRGFSLVAPKDKNSGDERLKILIVRERDDAICRNVERHEVHLVDPHSCSGVLQIATNALVDKFAGYFV